MRPVQREAVGDVVTLLAAAALFLSLFLTWSRPFSPAFQARWGATGQLHGIPAAPTAWQVYSIADVLLALLAVALAGIALLGSRRARVLALAAVGIALAFTAHAVHRPPTNGAVVFDASAGRYVAGHPSAGAGETVALAALGVAVAGVGLSLSGA